MIKKIVSLNSTNLKGLLHKRNEFHFVKQLDLIHLFITLFYPKGTVLIIYNGKKAFESIPKLIIKKRDDYTSYLLGMISDMVFVEFESPLIAADWAFSFPEKAQIEWGIFLDSTLIRNQKGVVKPPVVKKED